MLENICGLRELAPHQLAVIIPIIAVVVNNMSVDSVVGVTIYDPHYEPNLLRSLFLTLLDELLGVGLKVGNGSGGERPQMAR